MWLEDLEAESANKIFRGRVRIWVSARDGVGFVFSWDGVRSLAMGFCAGEYIGSAECWFQLDDPTHYVKRACELVFFP